MDAQAPMPKRLRIIFRVLAALTLLEGLAGLYGVALDIFMVPFVMEYTHKMEHSYVHSMLLLFLMAAINLVFEALLFVAGTFLWKLQRKGLFLLVCTLLGEIAYFMGALLLSIHLDRPHSVNFALLVGTGNIALGLQMLTAFPVAAGVLIFLAYRYWGIPARPLQ